ncbi:MAG: polysulfide reductase NrfD [Thaumarchaeota archaeon]|nr:polysulfide reductase NrfD [Nitrososphaerota archaeon]
MTERINVGNEAILAPLRLQSVRYYALVSGLLAVIAWGGYAYYVQLTTGLGVTGMRGIVSWGFYIINFVFMIGISHAGTLISAILRVANAEWRRPITRMAESITVMAILVGALFPIIDMGRPDRIANVFLFGRLQSPLTWDYISIGTYLVGSITYLYIPLIPDIAACRDSLTGVKGLKRWIYTKLSLGWTGTHEQEERLKKAIKIMAVIIIPVAVSVHSVVSWDFAMTLRVEWHSTVFAPYFVAGAIFSGIATIIIMMAIFRHFYHLEEYLKIKHFLYLGFMMFALDIAMIYFTISKNLVAGYGAEKLDAEYLSLLFTGQYSPLFWFMIVGGLITPAFLIAFPRTRQIKWIVLAAVLVDLGMWIERYLVVVPALAVPQLPYPLGQYGPTWVEFSIVAAGFAGFALLLAVFGKLFPIISIWEINEGRQGATESYPPVSNYPAESRAEDSTPRTASRRQFLASSAMLMVGLGSGLGTSRLKLLAVGGAAQPEKKIAKQKISTSNLGRSVTLEGARRAANFPIALPSSLPSASVRYDVRISGDGKLISLLYKNSSLAPLSMYQEEVAIAIFQRKDDLHALSGHTPSGFARARVGGGEALAREPTSGIHAELEPGQIKWLRSGIRYSIFANLDVLELEEIAESMMVE